MLSRTKRELRAVEDRMAEFAEKAKSIIDSAAQEGRSRTDEENTDIAELHKGLEILKTNRRELSDQLELEEQIQGAVKDISQEPDEEPGVGLELQRGFQSVQTVHQAKSIGDQFIESPQFKRLADEIGTKGITGEFSTGAVEIQSKAGTLLAGGQGAGFIPVPQVVPGVVEKLFERLTVEDLLASGSATSSSLRYLVEGTATSGAAGVAEGGDKPASDLAVSTTDEPVKKIATILTTSDEMLEDAAQVQSYINGRLSLFIAIKKEAELINGGGGNGLAGLLGRSGVNTWARGTVDSNAVALFKAMNGTRGSSFLDVDGIIMNPENWQTTRLAVDSAGQFFGGGPFLGPYGGPQGPSTANRFAMDMIWNVPVVITSAIGAGTALVGSFKQAAQVFHRGGLTVEATNSHSDYFTKNLVAIRAEERLALAVYRPHAFTKVTGLN